MISPISCPRPVATGGGAAGTWPGGYARRCPFPATIALRRCEHDDGASGLPAGERDVGRPTEWGFHFPEARQTGGFGGLLTRSAVEIAARLLASHRHSDLIPAWRTHVRCLGRRGGAAP